MKEEYFNEIADNELELFLAKSKSKIWIDSAEEEVLIDYKWVDKVEECLPYIDKIVRNPRKFLMQEEDVVPVEKARRTTPETVRHLAMNTNFIQNIDEEGFIQPSKVLNVRKEDTVDIYENRFIYTLLNNMNEFVGRQLEVFGDEGSYYKCERKTTYEADTKLKNETVKVTVSMECSKKYEIPELDDGEKSMKERLEEIKIYVAGFMNSQFIKSLRQVAPIHGPVRKTNVILRDVNFKKAYELWEFLEAYKIMEPKITKKSNTIVDNENVRDRFDFGYFIDYNSLSLLESFEEKKESKLFNNIYIKNLIENYLNEIGGSEKTFIKMLKEQFKSVYKNRKKREAAVKKLYLKFVHREEENFKKCEMLLK